MLTIVGASSAGLFAAYLLAEAGFKVKVFEKNPVIGPPPRTLIVTAKIFDILPFDLGKALVNQIKGVKFFSPNQSNSLEFRKPDLVIEREKLLQLLAQKAAAAGVEIHTNTELKSFSTAVYTAVLLNGNAETTTLIDASGAKKSANTVALLQAEVETPNGIDKEAIQVFFDPPSPRLRRAGSTKTKYFFWLIPKSSNEAAVGLIANDMIQAKTALDNFLTERNLRAQSYQQGQAPLFSPRTKISKGDVSLVGDAASQVKNSTVGGVVAGLRGAKALAKSIIKGTSYQKEARSLNWELTLHWLARRVLNNLTNEDYDQLLELLTPEVKKVFATCTRDEAAQGILKLFSTQPRFLPFLLKIF